MNRDKIKKLLNSVPPPSQPDLLQSRYVSDVRWKISAWNDTNIKNLACFIQFRTSGAERELNMFPDNCIKFLFECPAEADGSKAKFLGINTEATGIRLLPDMTYFVFMPYSHLGLNLRLSHSDLLNVNTDAENALPVKSALLKCQDLISEEKSFDDKIDIIINNASKDINDRYTAGISEFCSLAMCLSHGIMDAKAIEMFTGYSDRYCRGVFKGSYGFSPKRYCRIVRFQGVMLEMMESREKSTLDIVSDHGYFDQTHFIKDFKQFAKVCPNEFRHALAPKAPLPVRV